MFADPKADEKFSAYGLNGLITLCFDRKEVIDQYDDYVHTKELASFMKFFAGQLSFAWSRLIDGITDALKMKIDSISVELSKSGIFPSIQNHLKEIAQMDIPYLVED